MRKNKEVINITKEEKELAAITIVKTLSDKNVPIEDIEHLSGKTKKEIKNIINNIKK